MFALSKFLKSSTLMKNVYPVLPSLLDVLLRPMPFMRRLALAIVATVNDL